MKFFYLSAVSISFSRSHANYKEYDKSLFDINITMVYTTLSKALIYLKVTLTGCSGFGWLVAFLSSVSE